MKSKILCHCFECGYNIEIINDNPKVISYGDFFEHKIVGTQKRCLEKGETIMKVNNELGSNGSFVFRSMTVYRS